MRKGLISLLIAAFAWSWPNVMIRMLRTDFDVFTQSFFRYIAASAFLFTVGLIFTRKNIVHAAVNIKMLLVPALIMAIHQIFFTAGIFMTSANVSSLVGRLNAVIIPILSCIFYEDERLIVGNKNFLLGTFLALLGVFGVIMGRGPEKIVGFNWGFVFVFIGTLGWSVYAVYMKKIVRSIEPLSIIAFVSLLSIIFFLPVVLIFGDIHKVTQVPTMRMLLLFGSGILGIGVGNIFYYHAIRNVGTSIASVFFLMLPFSVSIVAFFVLGETLTVMQIISGTMLLLGCGMVTLMTKRGNAVKTASVD
jgi:drug/metabolite transporter (DMT)-like permease